MSSVCTSRARRTSYSSGPKRSPTGPTTRTSSKNDAASAKWTAEPPSIRSRAPNGVRTASKAIDPTTVTLIARASLVVAPAITLRLPALAPADYPAAVRAIQMTEFGGPEVLALADLPGPGRRRARC